MLPECLAINTLRLERDWTWREVGAEFSRAGVPMSFRTLHYLCTQDVPIRPLDRTRRKLQIFLDYATRKGWLPPLAPDEGDADAAPILRSHDHRAAVRRRPARLRQ